MSGTAPPPANPLAYPVIMTASGLQPQPPAALLAQLIQLVTFGTDQNGNQVMQPLPGYTANLPGSLIEDISSTDVGALIVCDQARVELVNSLTPFGANAFILTQLGQMLGIPQGELENVTVPLIFSGTVGYFIQAGFQVNDGQHTYSVVTGGAVGSSGQSPILTGIATQSGSWPVPPGNVTAFTTSVPSAITLAVTNPSEGQGGTTAETIPQYRLRVLQAEVATCQGTAAFLKTQLQAISGVTPSQVAVQSVPGQGWKVICGGTGMPDPIAIAAAIYRSVPDIATLVASVLGVAAVTRANPGAVTTTQNHGFATGQVVSFSGVGGMTALNTGTYTITVTGPTTFTLGIDTTGFPAYTTGGIIAPNLRNNLVAIIDYPDTYNIPFVTPPSQTCAVDLTWNAASPTFAAGTVVSQLAQAAIVSYINNLPVGAPINLFAMEEQVQIAVAALLSADQLSRMIWTVTINGVPKLPIAGTGLIVGDGESFFIASNGTVIVAQG